ncbi:FAD-binding oxidoreductase [Flexivirga meconopsidis]|uniref:FAD-binding oxidoreductase n=1 Tax=Flexivirga meconopsidis TaxID=2977121 RepID=UPI00223F4B25|nr:FAD-binding oxidoreductase [Flexivirga meconopsidis]
MLQTRPRRARPRFHPLTVSRVERLTDRAVAISFAIPEELRETFAFRPGQHLTLRTQRAGEEVRRSYSICLSRDEAARRGELRIGSAVVDGGLMSTWLNEEVRAGDVIDVLPALGDFTVPTDPTRPRHHVAIAAGSGITPVLSLLTTVLEDEPESHATLIFGNRDPDSAMFLAELELLADRYPDRFTLVNVYSRVPQPDGSPAGRLGAARLEQLLGTVAPPDAVDEWYLCGPFEMVENARKLLAHNAVEPHHVHHEVFHVDGPV